MSFLMDISNNTTPMIKDNFMNTTGVPHQYFSNTTKNIN